MQPVAELRGACEHLAHPQESLPSGPTTLVVKVGGKMYALSVSDVAANPLSVSLKVRPEQAEALRARWAAVPEDHLNKRHWITVILNGSVPDAPVQRLLEGGYALEQIS